MVRILIVEDSAPQAVQIGVLLQREGFEPEIVGEAYAALARLQRSDLPRFDLIISDVRMPGLSGYEFCRQIKLDESLRDIPVMLMTGVANSTEIVDNLACGADDFLAKPYKPAQLVEHVRNCLENRGKRNGQKAGTPIDVFLGGRGISADSPKEQLFELLVSTIEESLATNRELIRSRIELTETKAKIESYAEQLEGKVRLSEDRNAMLMEHANSAILVLDADGVVLEANREAATILARPEEDIIGVRLDAFIVGTEAGFHRTLERLLKDGTLRLHNIQLRRPDGQEVWVDTAAACVRVGGEILVHLIWSNVTERVRLEQQLRQSQKMEAVGQLTGGLAHDFNNLLGVIIGNLDLMIELDLPDEAKDLLDDALSASLRGASLIQKLLAFSRRQPLQPKRVQINETLAETAVLLQRTLGGNILVESHAAPDTWPLMIDQSQLDSSLLNLAVNARDAMPNGGKLSIEVSNVSLDEAFAALHPGAIEGDYVLISVTDTGVGMTPEVLSQVFDPFFTTKGQKGTGLGLSMVFGFVKQSGGYVKIYSEPGHGTTVRMYLPRSRSETDEDDAAQLQAGPLPVGSGTVLVVDDNDQIRSVAAKQIRDLGYTVHTAESGEAALRMLRDGLRVDLVLTDIVMPGGMDGRQLGTEIRNEFPSIKLVFSSGFTESVISASIGETFGSLILSKPYRKAELAYRLREALEND